VRFSAILAIAIIIYIAVPPETLKQATGLFGSG